VTCLRLVADRLAESIDASEGHLGLTAQYIVLLVEGEDKDFLVTAETVIIERRRPSRRI
jgi:hypothetical protein